MLVQPAGYAITIASWENDTDFSATKTMNVATVEQAHIVTAIAKLFRSDWKNGTTRGETSFDNMFCAIVKIIGTYPLFEQLFGWGDFVMPTEQDFENCEPCSETEDNLVEHMYDAVFELLASLGLNGQQEDQYTRVAESITVHYYPEAVYAEDVTSTFI